MFSLLSFHLVIFFLAKDYQSFPKMHVKRPVQDPILNVVEIVNILIRCIIPLRLEMAVMGDIIIVFRNVKKCIINVLRDVELKKIKTDE